MYRILKQQLLVLKVYRKSVYYTKHYFITFTACEHVIRTYILAAEIEIKITYLLMVLRIMIW